MSDGLEVQKVGPNVADQLQSDLRDRATRHRETARQFLIAIFVIIGIGMMVVFVFSGDIASRDSSAITEDQLTQLAEYRREAEKSLKNERSDVMANINELNAVYRDSSSYQDPEQRKDIQGRIASFRRQMEEHQGHLTKQMEAMGSLRATDDALAKFARSLNEGTIREMPPGQLGNLISVRATVAVLLIFLVQILNGSRRYHLRLSSFFDSRADALTLRDSGLSNSFFSDAVALLSSDAVGFGAEPKSPIEQGLGMWRELRSAKAEDSSGRPS